VLGAFYDAVSLRRCGVADEPTGTTDALLQAELPLAGTLGRQLRQLRSVPACRHAPALAGFGDAEDLAVRAGACPAAISAARGGRGFC
jgi:hypothetical protein